MVFVAAAHPVSIFFLPFVFLLKELNRCSKSGDRPPGHRTLAQGRFPCIEPSIRLAFEFPVCSLGLNAVFPKSE